MPPPLKDIEERIELLKMTLGMFAPSEPIPVAAELLQLGEEILEHAVLARGQTPATQPAGEPRVLELQTQCERIDARLAALREPCRRLLEHYDAVMGMPDDDQAGPRLLAAAQAAGDLYSLVAGRQS